METETWRLLRIRPRAAAAMPLPTELTTPPVTKMYLGMDPCLGKAATFWCCPPIILGSALDGCQQGKEQTEWAVEQFWLGPRERRRGAARCALTLLSPMPPTS